MRQSKLCTAVVKACENGKNSSRKDIFMLNFLEVKQLIWYKQD